MNTESETLQEFKAAARLWFDQTDQLIEVLEKAYYELNDKYKLVLQMLDALNTKVDVIAYTQGILKREEEPLQ